ncbi:metallophosphoesterase family protein [Primorskyibacter sp. 2E233]|uniref:metallophosphoesterase family protein n=1 Tax=Primorskyibacter sp. 2E233 TaxID=3413431 RepID=UPI003BF1232A
MTGIRAILGAVLLLIVSGAASAQVLRVAVISDLNGSYGSTEYNPRVSVAVQRIIALAPDLVISTGDMVAGQRRPILGEPEVRAMWDAFHETVTNPLTRAGIPVVVTPGNHDASAYGGFERERAIFAEEWILRKPKLDFVDDRDFPFFYAFRMKGMTFVSLDATVLGPLSGGQEQRLCAAAAGRGTVIAYSHLPLWPFAVDRETEVIGDPGLQDLFRSIGLDMHLSGHHHAFYPGWKDGTVFVGQGCLGGGPRRLIGTTKRSVPSFTLLAISETGDIGITAYQGETFSEPVDWAGLPPRIVDGTSALTRLDLAPQAP